MFGGGGSWVWGTLAWDWYAPAKAAASYRAPWTVVAWQPPFLIWARFAPQGSSLVDRYHLENFLGRRQVPDSNFRLSLTLGIHIQ